MADFKLSLTLVLVFTLFSPSHSWVPKRTNEATNYYYSPPEYTFQTETEPTCEELRAIWRLTKRTAQQGLLSNEIHNPNAHFGYVMKTPSILDVKPGRGVKTRQQSYGKVLIQPHRAQPGAAFDEVAKKLKTDVLLGRTVHDYSPQIQPSSVVYAPLDPNSYDYATVRSNGGTRLGKSRQRDLLADYDKTSTEFGSYQLAKTDNTQQLNFGDCREVTNKKCYNDNDCACYDDSLMCTKGRCKSKTINGKVSFNTWDDNQANEWQKNTQPDTPNSLINRNKEMWRKSLQRTDRKKVGAYPDYYSKHKFNTWT